MSLTASTHLAERAEPPGPVHSPHQLVLGVDLFKLPTPLVPHSSLDMLHMVPSQVQLQLLLRRLLLSHTQPSSKRVCCKDAATGLLAHFSCWAAWGPQVGVLLQQPCEACQRRAGAAGISGEQLPCLLLLRLLHGAVGLSPSNARLLPAMHVIGMICL